MVLGLPLLAWLLPCASASDPFRARGLQKPLLSLMAVQAHDVAHDVAQMWRMEENQHLGEKKTCRMISGSDWIENY